MRLQATIAREVHAARPERRGSDGDELLAEAMATIAHDAAQRTPAEPLRSGALKDPESLKAQRFLLRCLYPERKENAA